MQDGRSAWRCRCRCGEEVVVSISKLRNGNTRSCGCLRREGRRFVKHGACRGGVLLPEYRVWAHMRERCESRTSKDYKNYGGRGIGVCRRWASFANFYKDMGKRPTRLHTIERIKNHLGYAPKNCRWATPQEQANNRRVSLYLLWRGQKKTVAQWARELGMPMVTLWVRVRRLGWSADRALSTPVRRYGRVVS